MNINGRRFTNQRFKLSTIISQLRAMAGLFRVFTLFQSFSCFDFFTKQSKSIWCYKECTDSYSPWNSLLFSCGGINLSFNSCGRWEKALHKKQVTKRIFFKIQLVKQSHCWKCNKVHVFPLRVPGNTSYNTPTVTIKNRLLKTNIESLLSRSFLPGYKTISIPNLKYDGELKENS